MNLKSYLFGLTLVIFLLTPGIGKVSAQDKSLETAFDAMQYADDGTSVSGLSVIAIKNGEVAYSYSGGRRYIDNENSENDLPFTEDTKLRIASVSKSFTAAAIMQLVDQDKIDLDTDVSEYLEFTLRNPNYPDKPVTCRQLLSHTSSLDDADDDSYVSSSSISLEEYFRKDGVLYNNGDNFLKDHAPGEFYNYCNLNYGALATLIEKISGQRFDVYMTENILEPMGLSASFNVNDFNDETLDLLSPVYVKDRDADGAACPNSAWKAAVDDYRTKARSPFAPDDYIPGTNATSFGAQGGLRISANELSEWALMFCHDGVATNGKRILSQESVDLMFTPQWTWNGKSGDARNGNFGGGATQQYGFGIKIMTNGIGGNYQNALLKDSEIPNLAGHYGDACGMLSGFFIDRENDCGFLFLINGAECSTQSGVCDGKYSENYSWSEQIATCLYDSVLKEYKVNRYMQIIGDVLTSGRLIFPIVFTS